MPPVVCSTFTTETKQTLTENFRLWRIVQKNWRILKDTSGFSDYRVYRQLGN
jgi:hypothetical protein